MSKTEEKIKLRGLKAPVVITSVGAVALAVALGGCSPADGPVGSGEDGETGPAGEVSQAAEGESGTEAAAGGESMCGLPGNDRTEIEEVPTDLDWSMVGTVEAPVVPDVGPGQIADGGLRQCYAHSPMGALVAAANVVAMGSDPNLTQALHEELVAEGPGRDAVLEDLEQNGVPVDGSGIRISIEGYRLVEYEPEHARIDLAVEGTDGTISSVTTDFRWEAGDWKVELSPDGEPIIPVAQLADTDEYTPWSAERPQTAVW